MSQRRAILVLGMHRSGTSLLTRLLGHLGAALPADSIDAHADNAKGYWEPQALVTVDDRILRTARTSWFDPRPLDLARIPAEVAADHRARIRAAIAESFGDAPLIAVKDPRMCRLVPLFRDALAEVDCRAVLVLRPPQEIARSLAARDGSTPAYAHALWLRHMIDAERETRDLPRVVLRYEALLEDWRGAMDRLGPLLDRAGWVPDTEEAQAIERSIDRDLRHHRAGGESGLEPRVEALMAEAHACLLALADCDDAAGRARFDALATAYDADRQLLDDIIHDELRHRRHRDLVARGGGQEQDAVAAPEPAEEPAPAPPPDRPRSPVAEEIAIIRGARLFDEPWYLERYPDVAAAGADPIEHYLTVGAAEGRDPGPLFQTAYYARQMARRLPRIGDQRA